MTRANERDALILTLDFQRDWRVDATDRIEVLITPAPDLAPLNDGYAMTRVSWWRGGVLDPRGPIGVEVHRLNVWGGLRAVIAALARDLPDAVRDDLLRELIESLIVDNGPTE